MIIRHFSSSKNVTITIPDNLIWYTSTDGNVVTPYNTNVFGSNLVENTYINGQGVMVFYGDVTSIGDDAFYGCSFLTYINIPHSVTSIGYSAFDNCTSLTSVVIPDGVTSIGENAFRWCSSLTSIIIPSSVTSIENQAFYGCSSLTSVTIPNSVTYIGDSAFKYCYSLISITCEAINPPTLDADNRLSNVAAVYVPAESVDAYRAADNWSYYADKILPIP